MIEPEHTTSWCSNRQMSGHGEDHQFEKRIGHVGGGARLVLDSRCESFIRLEGRLFFCTQESRSDPTGYSEVRPMFFHSPLSRIDESRCLGPRGQFPIQGWSGNRPCSERNCLPDLRPSSGKVWGSALACRTSSDKLAKLTQAHGSDIGHG